MIVFQSLPYVPLRITSPYGDRTEQVKNIPGATKWHDGVDIGRDKKKTDFFFLSSHRSKHKHSPFSCFLYVLLNPLTSLTPWKYHCQESFPAGPAKRCVILSPGFGYFAIDLNSFPTSAFSS